MIPSPQLPDWLPWWAVVLALIPAGIYVLLLFIMPFSVFGLKGRLDLIEARLDELQFMIRQLGSLAPDLPPVAVPEEEPPPRRAPFARPAGERAPRPAEASAAPAPPPRPRAEPPDRMEPRLNWPRGNTN